MALHKSLLLQVTRRKLVNTEMQQIVTLTVYRHINTAEQQTIIQQYGEWYSGGLWVGCYIWYSDEPVAATNPLIAVPNVTTHPSTACVSTSYHSMCLCTTKG